MTQDFSPDANNIAGAMNAVYENKQTNKKNNISGDFSSDNVSYPTVKAVKSEFGQKVTSFGNSPSDTNYPSEKLVKDTIDSLSTGKTVTLEKLSTATTGYIATYEISQGGTSIGKIDIPKDYLVKSATLGTCTTADVPVQGYVVGDKYLDFVINTKDGSGSDEHIYVNVKDLIDIYSADETTIHLASGVFSIKSSGVDTTQLKDGAVTSDKIALSVKNSWLTETDVENKISAFATAVANAINPPSNP